jgi:pyrroline-5-carboxylate reductase
MNSAARSVSARFGTRTVAKATINKLWLSTGAGMFDKMAFIGTGKMAQAMINPLIKNGHQPEDKIAVYDVSTAAMKSMKKKFPNIQTAKTIAEVVTGADMIVCAVKPQNINASFFEQFPKDIREDATMLSILAGTPIRDFEPSGIKKIVRSMPNTPAMIQQGVTVWCCTPNINSQERDCVKEMLDTFGKTVCSTILFLLLYPESSDSLMSPLSITHAHHDHIPRFTLTMKSSWT